MNKTLDSTIVGQNEINVFKRLGAPTHTIVHENGNKVWVYKSVKEQLHSGPNKSWHSSTHSEQLAVRKSRTFKSSIEDITIRTPDKTAAYTVNDDKAYTSNQPFLKVYFNRQAKCVHFEQNMSSVQMEMYNERLQQYLSVK